MKWVAGKTGDCWKLEGLRLMSVEVWFVEGCYRWDVTLNDDSGRGECAESLDDAQSRAIDAAKGFLAGDLDVLCEVPT